MTPRATDEKTEDIAVALFGELFMTDQLARNRISKVLPKGMELSHFGVLNHLPASATNAPPRSLPAPSTSPGAR